MLHDLNLDQVIAAVAGDRPGPDAPSEVLRRPQHDPDTVRYRQEIFADLDDALLLARIGGFCEQLRSVDAHLAELARMDSPRVQEGWFLTATGLYCDAVQELAEALAATRPRSRGLTALRGFLDAYLNSEGFRGLAQDTGACRTDLAAITYCVRIRGLRVQVSRYTGQPDHSAEVAATFERFAPGRGRDYRVTYRGEASINHVGARILDLVARLHPDEFAALRQYHARHREFVDPTLARAARELRFYLSYLGHIAPLRAAGLPFCTPELATDDKSVHAADTFDLALAAKLVAEERPVVLNEFALDGSERILAVSGPNQGGKTTFARLFGQLHQLAAVGCPVPGSTARLYLFDRLFSHFGRTENPADLRGKLEEDLVCVRGLFGAATPRSIVILNELFTSTTLQDARYLGAQVLDRMVATDLLGVYVTFVEELTRRHDSIVSLVSTTTAEDPARRTFRIVRGAADGTAHAIAVAATHRVTYEQLRKRLAR